MRCTHTTRIAEIGDSVYSRKSTRYASPPYAKLDSVGTQIK